jgi:CDP-diacylglycerol--serine O-phosphatidyltransferase
MKLFTIPNLITLANLGCGCIAIVFAFQGNLVWSAYLVGIAAVLDFLDGFAARALKQFSPIGKDLDSLADMVTFGVVPGVVMYKLLALAFFSQHLKSPNFDLNQLGTYANSASFVPSSLIYLGFLITLFSALRLAKFNNDSRQTDSFIGLPTPANSIFICSLPLILDSDISYEMNGYGALKLMALNNNIFTSLALSPWFLLFITMVFSLLLISEIPLFSLKIKSFRWKGNELRYLFLALSLAMLVLLKFIALPLIIVLYILLSVFNNLVNRKS